MEVVLFAILTFLVWAASLTILLPLMILLKYNKPFRNRWFAYIFSRWIKPIIMPTIVPLRKKTFDLLHEKLSGRDITKPLKVLEIGIACGGNLEYYPENSHLTALDVNVHFHSYFKENQKKYPHIVYERTVVSTAENMKDIASCSMDLVISVYVFCYLTSMSDALKEIKRVLKPGGTFLFTEHVGYKESEWGHTIQRYMSPLWELYWDGCHLTRKTGDAIQNAGFSDVNYKQVRPRNVNFWPRPHIYGLATK